MCVCVCVVGVVNYIELNLSDVYYVQFGYCIEFFYLIFFILNSLLQCVENNKHVYMEPLIRLQS